MIDYLKIIRAMEAKGYAVFRNNSKDFNLNIVGIRSAERTAGKFDDKLWVLWRDPNGNWIEKSYVITTDPGKYYLQDRILNPRGAAILKPGQYRGVYAVDWHRGQYRALCQRLGPVTVYRDNDRDDELDMAQSTEHTGFFGINIHRPHPDPRRGNPNRVGASSAGCQVFQSGMEHREFMALCYEAIKNWGNKFTYTLLDESDL